MESFNPQVLPSSSLSKKDHHKAVFVALWAVLGALIIGFAYWWIATKNAVENVPPPPPQQAPVAKTQAQLWQESVERFKNSPTSITPEEIKQLGTRLQKSKTTITEAQKLELVNRLK
jgi:uncharacterized protein HemX